MKSRQCYQATVLLSYLGVFSLTTANPLPENSYGSELDSINMFSDDDPGSPAISWDDTSAVGSDQGDQMFSDDSAFTSDLSNLGSIDGSLIAYGDKLKAPYCGSTEQPVCCSQISEAGYTGCRYCKASHPIPAFAIKRLYTKQAPISFHPRIIFIGLTLYIQSTQAISWTVKDLIKHAVNVSSQ